MLETRLVIRLVLKVDPKNVVSKVKYTDCIKAICLDKTRIAPVKTPFQVISIDIFFSSQKYMLC